MIKYKIDIGYIPDIEHGNFVIGFDNFNYILTDNSIIIPHNNYLHESKLFLLKILSLTYEPNYYFFTKMYGESFFVIKNVKFPVYPLEKNINIINNINIYDTPILIPQETYEYVATCIWFKIDNYHHDLYYLKKYKKW